MLKEQVAFQRDDVSPEEDGRLLIVPKLSRYAQAEIRLHLEGEISCCRNSEGPLARRNRRAGSPIIESVAS